jgi:hypothetical protein
MKHQREGSRIIIVASFFVVVVVVLWLSFSSFYIVFKVYGVVVPFLKNKNLSSFPWLSQRYFKREKAEKCLTVNTEKVKYKNILYIFNREDREELSRGVVERLSSLLLDAAEVSDKDFFYNRLFRFDG